MKFRQAGYGRGQAFFKFIYDSDEAETPSGYELVRTESWSGPDCTDEQIADIARYIISNDFYDEQQKALMLEAVDAFLAKEEKITVADGTPNYTPVATFSQITALDEKETTTTDTTSDVHYPISTNNVTYVSNPDRNLLDQLVCWVKKEDASSDSTNTASISLNNVTYIANPDRNLPDHLVCFVKKMDAETEAVTSVQVACAEDDGWHKIGTLNNPNGIDWKYQAGNLTGSGAASVVWHAQELGALGVWTDGTDNWTGIAGWFDENWTMLGCGDFNGDGKDSVLMSLNGGLFYSVDLDGTLTSLGDLNWGGWEFGAAGDFAGDGKDDIVLFHKELGCVVLLADGNADDYTSIGQLDASDWNIAGAGDFDGDGKDDLLVRQTSTGLAGAYASADMNRWSVVDTTADYYLA